MATLRQASENWVENAFNALKTRVDSAWGRVTKTGNTATISIHDTNDTTTTANVTDGTDGVSPAVTITTITGGHRVTITDATHPSGQSFDVLDGEGSEGKATKPTTGGLAEDSSLDDVISKLNTLITQLKS